MAKHGLTPRTADFAVRGEAPSTGKFGRLFPTLDPLRADEKSLIALAATMLESVGSTDDNPDVPAAYTYLGQFIDHNITFDATTVEESRVDPASLINYRSPRFDLDSVYGSGPVVQPHLYRRDDPDLFEIGAIRVLQTVAGQKVPAPGLQADLPRARNRFALIGDPRNDENLIVAQLHLAFLFFHNSIVQWLRANPDRREAPLRKTIFVEARDLAIRHYQWVILNDFLPKVTGADVIAQVRKVGSMMKETGRLFMPVEFSAAAYRFGHSALRPTYNIGEGVTDAGLKQLFKFSGRLGSEADVPINQLWIVEWCRLLHLEPANTDNTLSRRIDPYLADDLAILPLPGGGTQSLPEMNLLRGNMMGLPAGQSVAGFFGYEPLSPAEFDPATPDGAIAKDCGFDRDTPLWYYILKEALVRGNKGNMLGPVGARIVAEVFIGLLELDENSILNRARFWKPSLPCNAEGKFGLPELLRFAGVMRQDGPGPGDSLLAPCGYSVLDGCFESVPGQ